MLETMGVCSEGQSKCTNCGHGIGAGFTAIPHDWCVANKMINGKQCVILCHVDNFKILHVDPNVQTGIIKQLKGEFGKERQLPVGSFMTVQG